MPHLRERLAWLACAVLGVFVVASAAGVVSGGPLSPPSAPAPTMKTLDEIPGSWDRTLSSTGGCSSERFDCVFDDEAVLDRETGLVWERAPQPVDQLSAEWWLAVADCEQNVHVGRLGWRLPSAPELLSLLDMTADGANRLPIGSPFTIDGNPIYWTSTVDAASSANARDVNLGGSVQSDMKSTKFNYLCVRGPSAAAQ
jgi:hypothetical protein